MKISLINVCWFVALCAILCSADVFHNIFVFALTFTIFYVIRFLFSKKNQEIQIEPQKLYTDYCGNGEAMTSFDDLATMFVNDTLFFTQSDGACIGIVKHSRFTTDSFCRKHFQITGSFFKIDSGNFTSCDGIFSISHFTDSKKRKDIDVILMEHGNRMPYLVSMDTIFIKYGIGTYHVTYVNMFTNIMHECCDVIDSIRYMFGHTKNDNIYDTDKDKDTDNVQFNEWLSIMKDYKLNAHQLMRVNFFCDLLLTDIVISKQNKKK